jgi:hypothetical protein
MYHKAIWGKKIQDPEVLIFLAGETGLEPAAYGFGDRENLLGIFMNSAEYLVFTGFFNFALKYF